MDTATATEAAPRNATPSPVAQRPRLLDQVRAAIRTRHYSLRTEEAYVHWIKRYIIHHGKRHLMDMGAPEIEAFLSNLATERSVAASTQNQALAALLFLYRHVLDQELERGLAGWRPADSGDLARRWLDLIDGVEAQDTGARLRARELVRESFARIVLWHAGEPAGAEDGQVADLEITARGGGRMRLRIDRLSGGLVHTQA